MSGETVRRQGFTGFAGLIIDSGRWGGARKQKKTMDVLRGAKSDAHRDRLTSGGCEITT